MGQGGEFTFKRIDLKFQLNKTYGKIVEGPASLVVHTRLQNAEWDYGKPSFLI